MKQKKTHLQDFRTKKEIEAQGYDKKQMTHRRPIRNWTRTYEEHENEIEEIEDFHIN